MASVTIIIPAYNEERNIVPLVTRIRMAMNKNPQLCPVQIIVSCDQGNDGTASVAKQTGVTVIVHHDKTSKTAAVARALQKASGDVLAVIDADLSQRPEEIPSMIRMLLKNHTAGIIAGSRVLGTSTDATAARHLGGRLATALFNIWFATRCTDVLFGLRVFHRSLIEGYTLTTYGFGVDFELLALACRKHRTILEIPSREDKRYSEQTKSRFFRDGLVNIIEIMRLGIAFRLRKRPY